MKKFFLVVLVAFIFLAGFCVYVLHEVTDGEIFMDDDVSVSVRENDETYQLNARYHHNKARRIQRYLDAQLRMEHKLDDARIDANVTLDDMTHVYIKTLPGRLLIRLDKDHNSAESYDRIRRIGEGIKLQLAD
jgi:hypothetical protein